MTTIVTYDTGGTARTAPAVCVLPDRQVPVEEVPAGLAATGLRADFLADFLSACLAHERCGTHLYRSVATRTSDADLRARYEHFGDETGQHVEKLEQLIAGAGGDPQYVSAAARATEQAAAGLLASTI